MISKNLFIVLVVVVVLGAGSMGYHYFKNEKDVKVHQENTFRQLTEAAKKSPRAGLDSMARAIKQYQLENKSYPSNINALYPKYISDKSFIDEIDWDYKQQGDNFILSKRTTFGNQMRVASINKSLTIRLGTDTMFAMVDQKPAAAPTAGAAVKPSKPATVKETPVIAAAKIPKPQLPLGLLPEGDKPLVAKKPEEMVPPPEEKEAAGEKIITYTSQTEIEIIASGLSSEFLVWKNRDGSVGFGNIQYPETDHIDYINVNGTWYKISK
jgi:hypothetical protein